VVWATGPLGRGSPDEGLAGVAPCQESRKAEGEQNEQKGSRMSRRDGRFLAPGTTERGIEWYGYVPGADTRN